jgi:hypothetical protein
MLSPEQGVFSKPDHISDTLELRRLHVPEGLHGELTLGPESPTDFYELYWQHLLQGTEWQHVWRFAIPLLCKRRLPPRLHRMRWRIAAFIAPVAVLVALAWQASTAEWLAAPAVLAVGAIVGRVVLQTWDFFGLRYVGDAARYLSPDPSNVEIRRTIRTAGLTLLRRLHADPLRRYERIVLVGHSLGSVIAYDMITWFWQEMHHRVVLPGREPAMDLTFPVESTDAADQHHDPLKELHAPDPPANAAFHAGQSRLWLKLTSPGSPRLPWKITDLITLGSPLTHADALLADDRDAFEIAVTQREFPRCPPTPDDDRDKKLLVRHVATPAGTQEIRILHHGAPFAVTRWTNLYFPGDVIGGPLRPLFGDGVKDVPLRSDNVERSVRSHTRYWSLDEPSVCGELRTALDLTGRSLMASARGDASATTGSPAP